LGSWYSLGCVYDVVSWGFFCVIVWFWIILFAQGLSQVLFRQIWGFLRFEGFFGGFLFGGFCLFFMVLVWGLGLVLAFMCKNSLNIR
jgi:hypothetical protein